MNPRSRPRSGNAVRRMLGASLTALFLAGASTAFAAESGSQTTAPSSPTPAYGTNGADLTTAIPTWYYTRNAVIQANVTTKTAGNNAQGAFVSGWPVDIYSRLGNVRETLDWTEGVIAMPSTAYVFTGQNVALTSVSQAAGSVTATGAWQGGAIDASTTYTALGDAPVVKIDVTLTNTGSTAIASSFGYVMDPDDANAQTSITPGLANNAGLVSGGWTSNYTYQGPASNAVASPGHSIAWLADNPSALYTSSSYTSVWFPVDLAPGATDTISLYHIVAVPAVGADPTTDARYWAAQLRTLDPAAAAEVGLVHGRVAGPNGAGLGGVTIKARDISSALAGTATTANDGTYSMLLKPGTYTLTASALGYTNDSRSVSIVGGDMHHLDFEVGAVVASANTGREIPGALGEGGATDVVLENQLMSMAVAVDHQDPQLTPVTGGNSTKGKPIDMAATGLNDGIDWINLPYFSTARPDVAISPSTERWQMLQSRTDAVEIIDPGPAHAVVRATGHWADDPAVGIVTTYTILPGESWVTAETVLTNGTGAPITGYLGDVIDVDDGTQVSHVPGTGDITTPYASPATYQPSAPWIAQYGTQGQVYGLVYTDGFDFEADANGSWVMSVGQVTIPAGGTTTLARRIVVAPSADAGDRAGPVRSVWEGLLAEQTGVSSELAVDDTELTPGDIAGVSVIVANAGTSNLDATISVDPAALTPLDPLMRTITGLAPGERRTITFRLRAEEGGSSTITAAVATGGTVVSTSTAKIIVDGPGWYRGDNHSHSTYSDGSGTIAQNMASARSKGLSWLTATDHNTVNQRMVLGPEQRPDFIAMYGEEVTAGYGHSLAYNINSVISAADPPQTMLDNVNANNGGKGFLYIAHPYYPGLEWDDWTAIDGLRGIEVWNGFYGPKHVVNTTAFAKWDELNRAGQHLFGIANSDAHNPGKIGDPSIKAYLDALTPTEIIEALGDGGFYGTDGVDVRFTINGVRMGGDVAVLSTGGTVSVDLAASYAAGVSEVRLLVDGVVVQTWNPAAPDMHAVVALTLLPGQFVRMEADSAGGRFAFSNPIWMVDGAATPDAPHLATPTGATTDEVRLSWTGVAAATGYDIEEAPAPATPVSAPTTIAGWTATADGFTAPAAPSTTATLAFDVAGASILRYDEVLDTEGNIDWATVTAVLTDGSRVTLRRESGQSGGSRTVVLELPAGTTSVELRLATDAGDADGTHGGWQVSTLRTGSPAFTTVGTSVTTEASLVARPAGEFVYRITATLPGGLRVGSNLEVADVAVGSPGQDVPEAPLVALLGLSAAGLFLVARRRHAAA